MNCSIASTLPRTYKQVVRPHHRLQLVTVYKKVYFGVKTMAPPLLKPAVVFSFNEGYERITLPDVLTHGTYKKGRVSLHAQCTKQQGISHCAHACPKINHAILWNKVTGSLASLSLICLAFKILRQHGCHLLWLCGSVVNLLLWTACERRWQGLSIICLAAW